VIVPAEKPFTIHQHFSKIAHKYHQIRTTDMEPIRYIIRRIQNLERIEAIDIGCGVGRYDLLLFDYLRPKIRLTCADSNPDMLNNLEQNLTNHGITDFTTINVNAENIPSQDNTYDCVLTFNAIHHFDLREFLFEGTRILKPGGYFFIYTRLRAQNSRTIWGRYFPKFHQKETRLYTLNQFVRTVGSVPNLQLKTIEYFKYGRTSNLKQLLERVRLRHYSTFSLYSSQELELAIEEFTNNIMIKFKDNEKIHWFDENILFVLNKT